MSGGAIPYHKGLSERSVDLFGRAKFAQFTFCSLDNRVDFYCLASPTAPGQPSSTQKISLQPNLRVLSDTRQLD
jgi:hypothetical protein